MAKTLNVNNIVNGLEFALKAIGEIAPVAQKFELIAPVATIAISAVSIAQNILNRAQEGKEVLTSQDEAKIRAILADIQSANDKLNTAIKDS